MLSEVRKQYLSGKSKSLRNICFLKHYARWFWSNLCCTKSSHIESTTAPLPGQKPCANSHLVVFFHISLLHQLSKLKATNLLFTHLSASSMHLDLALPTVSLCSLWSSLPLLVTSFPQKCGIHASFHIISAVL